MMIALRTPTLQIMRPVVVGLLTVSLLLARPMASSAQQATPAVPADDIGLPEGVTLEILAYGVAPAGPSSPVDMTLYRLTFERGASYTLPGQDPSLSLAYVETGALAIRLTESVTVQRSGDWDGLFTEQTLNVGAGETAVLNQGDSVLLTPFIEGELRNEGEDVTRLLVSQVLQPNVPASE
jgi:hypothetical protein